MDLIDFAQKIQLKNINELIRINNLIISCIYDNKNIPQLESESETAVQELLDSNHYLGKR